MLLQCLILVLNDANAPHNEVRAFGNEPFRLFQFALHAVLYSVFFNSVFLVSLMCAGLSHKGLSARALRPVPDPSSTLLRHCCTLLSALCFTDYCQHFV